MVSSEFQIHDPHRFLGLHETASGQVIRLWRPDANRVSIDLKGEKIEARRVDEKGIFEIECKEKIHFQDYQVYHPDGSLSLDPYCFWPSLGEIDLYLFNKGCHYGFSSLLGANFMTHQGVQGVRFAVWAPNAKSVCLIADFNQFHGKINPMRTLGKSGIWELFIPGLKEGEKYKFEILTREDYIRVKSDPVAFYSELRPATASIVWDVKKYAWTDKKWMDERGKAPLERPMNVYEVHLGSWKYGGKEFPNYREIAVDLAQYCKEMHFTHVELLPVMEHPLDESWGYQVTGFFAATSRYGTPTDFQFFVDHMHGQGIGVILDWVPAHFPTDDYSLNRFDGTALYEHEDPRKGMHPHWGTAIFNYTRNEVCNFLIGSALFWFQIMHIDGLRVDAVASMVYLDYGRNAGEWIPNADGSNFNVDGIEFLKHLNATIHRHCPGVMTIAEESSAFSKVTHPLEEKGLGFDLKWNMGWMNDTLSYFRKDPIFRKHHQNDLTFSLLYAYSEKFLLALSHDEVVHTKNSLLSKMPGSEWEKFGNLKLLYSYMLCHPGKKLLFMGGEIGQWTEWDCKGQVDWPLLQFPAHAQLQKMVKDLNLFYLQHPALWYWDFDWRGYEWIDFSDAEKSLISYLRKSEDSYLVCVHNFTPASWKNYPIALKKVKNVREVFNSDHQIYGGTHRLNLQVDSQFLIQIPPLATLIFEVEFYES